MPEGRKIKTEYWPKPIPVRGFDWVATFDDYDAEVVDGEWVSRHPVGYGRTQADAIADLLDAEEQAP